MDFRSFSGSSFTSTSKSVRQSSNRAARASSAFSYENIKNFSALAVDLMAQGDIESAVPKKGDFYDDLKGDMGDGKYNDLCADQGLTLVQISYCQHQVNDQSVNLEKKNFLEASGKSDLTDDNVHKAKEALKWGLVNHDFLVLEIQPGKRKHSKFYILAEKLYAGKNGKAGIFIQYKLEKEIEDSYTDKTVSHSIECGKQIDLQDLMKILKSCDPDYCLRDLNCWDYAIRTVKKLLLDFAEDPGTSSEERDRLLDERQSLEANLLKKSMRNLREKVRDYLSKSAAAISTGFTS